MGIAAAVAAARAAMQSAIAAYGSGEPLVAPSGVPTDPIMPNEAGTGLTSEQRVAASAANASVRRSVESADEKVGALMQQAMSARAAQRSAVVAQSHGMESDIAALGPHAGSAAGRSALLQALTSRITAAQGILADSHATSQGLAAQLTAVDYKQGGGGGSGASGLPPAPAPGKNDDWAHGGDRRLSSRLTAQFKRDTGKAAELDFLRKHEPNAARFLWHYLGNSGKPMTVDSSTVDKWLTGTTTGYDGINAPGTQVQQNLQQALAAAHSQAVTAGHAVTVSDNSGWSAVGASSSTPDAVHTLGRFSVNTATNINMNPDGTYTMQYRNDLYDWYNFDTSAMGSNENRSVSNAMHDLQSVGWAQDFLVTGSGAVQSASGRVQ
ncbi:hypothetical protein P0W64_21175 [Tsukamurella sp. 8F]|uniref:hypothetical protein n=1 Tax=unclassified Tsukamurella TaxID=2633480 RepID=UPI0023B91A56|nr:MULTISPECIES: hypothetical protein [unclassified Tsukamurella]MDF0532270.1 hypothetical protein [Tsukamurella sp. 8J]MDF0589296.1 hypothetical protein [Tsukamurella sp. 8F]